MSLRTLLARMEGESAAHGEASATLAGGATLRLRADGLRRQLVIGRVGAPVGLVETQTFLAHGDIPPNACAWCALPTAGAYRLVVEWERPPATLWDLDIGG
jgi:hypothetical protein